MNLIAVRWAVGRVVRRRDTGADVLVVEAEAGDGVSAIVIDGAARTDRVLRSQLEPVDGIDCTD